MGRNPSAKSAMVRFTPSHKVNWLNGLPCRSPGGTGATPRRSTTRVRAPSPVRVSLATMIASPREGIAHARPVPAFLRELRLLAARTRR
jgi:hypothetical protein